MKNVKENAVVAQTSRILNAHGEHIYYIRPVPGVFGVRTLDFIGTAYGYGFVIETKRPGAQPTDHQKITLIRAHKAGAAAFKITGLQAEYDDLSVWLNLCKANPAPDYRFPIRVKLPTTLD